MYQILLCPSTRLVSLFSLFLKYGLYPMDTIAFRSSNDLKTFIQHFQEYDFISKRDKKKFSGIDFKFYETNDKSNKIIEFTTQGESIYIY